MTSPDTELDRQINELVNMEFACVWCNRYGQMHLNDATEFKAQIKQLIARERLDAIKTKFYDMDVDHLIMASGALEGIIRMKQNAIQTQEGKGEKV